MADTWVVSPSGDDTNGGGVGDSYDWYVNGFTGFHSSFAPLTNASGCAVIEGTGSGPTIKLQHDTADWSAVKVGTLVYVDFSDTYTDGRFEIVDIGSNAGGWWIELGGSTYTVDTPTASVRIGGALLNLSTACALWTDGEILVGPGTHDITDTTKVTLAVTPTYNNWLRIHAIDANGVRNPAIKPILNASGTFAASCAMINLNGADFVMITGPEFNGNDIANLSYGIWDGNAASTDFIIDQVEVHHCKSHGIYGQNSGSVATAMMNISTHDNLGYGLIWMAAYCVFFDILTYNNGSYGFYAINQCTAANIKGYDNVYGLAHISYRSRFINCISSGSTNAAAAGFQVMGSGTATSNYHAVFKNCVSIGNPYGFKLGASLDSRLNGVYMDGCVAHNNSLGDEYWYAQDTPAVTSIDDMPLAFNSVNTEPPFVDAANKDFRVDMAHANAALLYNSTTGVLDGPLGPEIVAASGGGISTSRILGGI